MLGYRGTGKSVISKILSEKLRMKLYKIDKMVSELAGKSIPEIVEQDGWESFRKLESEIVAEVSNKAKNSIIDCGGGVVLSDVNMVNLKRYRIAADFICDTSQRRPIETAEKITEFLRIEGWIKI